MTTSEPSTPLDPERIIAHTCAAKAYEAALQAADYVGQCGSAIDALARERDEYRAEVERLRAALRELVALKDGPRDADYERRKPAAWDAARRALDGDGQPQPRTEDGKAAD